MLSCFSCLQLCATIWTAASRFLCPWDSPGKNTGVGCHAFLQGIFSTQESNLCSHVSGIGRWIFYLQQHQGSPMNSSILQLLVTWKLRSGYCLHLDGICRLYFYHIRDVKLKMRICVCVLSHLVMSDSLRTQCPWRSPGKNTGVGSHSLLQGIFPTQGWKPALLHCRQSLHHLRYQGSPWIENPWVQILGLLLPSAGSLTSLSLNFLLCQRGRS